MSEHLTIPPFPSNRIRLPALFGTLIILLIASPVVSQESTIIAALNFENKSILKDNTVLKVSTFFRKKIAEDSKAMVFDSWMIDTIISTQGNPELLKCRENSCLLAIGYLLVVDVVINGEILSDRKGYTISLNAVDVKSNSVFRPVKQTIKKFNRASVEMAVGILAEEIMQRISSNDVISTESGAAALQAGKTRNRASTREKSPVLKRLLIGTAAVAVIGGAIGGYSYYQSTNDGSPGGGDNPPAIVPEDIPLTDLPKHPH